MAASTGVTPPKMDADLWRLTIILGIVLLVVYSLAGHYISRFKILIIHESTIGILTGALVAWLLVDRVVIKFDSEAFFFFLLPPIVFASAYTL